MSDVLTAVDMNVQFGGVRALNHVSLAVPAGTIVGLIGPNGAGKTTFIDAITGFVPSRGSVLLDGRELSRLPPYARARAGLTRTWQSIELFDDLTVGENLAVSARRPGVRGIWREAFSREPAFERSVHHAMDVLGLASMVDAVPEDLSQGQRKLVGVARALAATPRIVCLDEPAAGLDTSESGELGATLRRIVDTGLSMLLIDHDMGLVLTICDYIYVIDFGSVIAEGAPADVQGDPAVIAAYLGDDVELAVLADD